jgi:hypothetical protein
MRDYDNTDEWTLQESRYMSMLDILEVVNNIQKWIEHETKKKNGGISIDAMESLAFTGVIGVS